MTRFPKAAMPSGPMGVLGAHKTTVFDPADFRPTSRTISHNFLDISNSKEVVMLQLSWLGSTIARGGSTKNKTGSKNGRF